MPRERRRGDHRRRQGDGVMTTKTRCDRRIIRLRRDAQRIERHTLCRPRRQRAGRAGARDRAVLGARLQYRQPDRVGDRAPEASVAHHHRHPGTPMVIEQIKTPARAAGAGPPRGRPHRGRPGDRARAGAGQGARQGREARRGPAPRRRFPRAGGRRHDRELRLRDHRHGRQDRPVRRR